MNLKKHDILHPLLLVLGVLLAHGVAFRYGFVWLDAAHVESGLAIVPLDRILSAFTESFAATGYYRPLVTVSLSLDAAVSQMIATKTAVVFHGTTLLFHLLACELLRRLCLCLGATPLISLVSALLVAVHPASLTVAELIAFRSEAMTMAGILGALLGHLGGRPVLCCLGLALAGLSKETGLVLAPLSLLSWELSQGFSPKTWLKNRAFLMEMGAAAALFVLRAYFAPPWRAAWPEWSVTEAAFTRLAALAKTTKVLVLLSPGSSVCDDFVVQGLTATSAAGLLVLLCLVFLAVERRGPFVWLLLSMLPALQLVPVQRFWSPHYAYIPCFFAAICLATSLSGTKSLSLDTEARGGRQRFYAALVLIAGLSLLTRQQGQRFSSDASLWQAELEESPQCREAQFFWGEVKRAQGDYENAAIAYQKALEVTPGTVSYVDERAALSNLGVSYLELKTPGQAVAPLARALALSKNREDQVVSAHNLGLALLLNHQPQRAVQVLSTFAEDPNIPPSTQKLLAAARELSEPSSQK